MAAKVVVCFRYVNATPLGGSSEYGGGQTPLHLVRGYLKLAVSSVWYIVFLLMVPR